MISKLDHPAGAADAYFSVGRVGDEMKIRHLFVAGVPTHSPIRGGGASNGRLPLVSDIGEATFGPLLFGPLDARDAMRALLAARRLSEQR